jgi:hypothetical protein
MLRATLLPLLLLAVVCGATEEAATQPTSAKFSQLYINAAEDQPARIVLGGNKESYSMGVDKDGFFISRFETEDLMSISPDGKVTFRANEVSAQAVNVQSFSVANVPQWGLIALDSFESKSASDLNWFAGAKGTEPLKCAGLTIITGPRGPQKIPNSPSYKKVYESLPKHDQVRVVSTVHFIDDWNGEVGYLKVNDQIVWVGSHDERSKAGAINVCGNKDPESKFSDVIDVTIPHKGDSLKVEFFSTLDSTAPAYFGMSSFQLYVR